MTVVMSDNFVGIAGQAFTGDSVYSPTGSPVFVASHYGVGVKCPATTQTFISEATFTGTSKRIFSRIYKLHGTPTSGNVTIFQPRTSAATAAQGQVDTAGKLRIYDSTSTITAVSTAALPQDTEFRVVYTINGTSFTAAIYPDISSTTPTQTLSITLGISVTMVTVRDGIITAATAGLDVTIVWPVDDDTADPGLRVYVALALDISTGIIPKTVNATATVENAAAGTKAWTFTWGDGNTTGPQAGATASHNYTVAGSYGATVTLDIT
jgi:hypothetical protein